MNNQEAESSHPNKIWSLVQFLVLTQNSLTERGRTLHTTASAYVNDFLTASPKRLGKPNTGKWKTPNILRIIGHSFQVDTDN